MLDITLNIIETIGFVPIVQLCDQLLNNN